MRNKVYKGLLKLAFSFFILSFALISCKTMGAKESPPEVKYKQNYLVISPNQDGIQDELVIEANFKSTNYIRYWEMQILNEKKYVIFTKNSGENLEELKKKIFFKKENIALPEEYHWDGMNSDGIIQPDGKYFIKFIVMDNKKNIIDTEDVRLETVYIDTKPPLANTSIENKIFSPNNDGNKDQLNIFLKITPDELEKNYEELKGKDWYIDVLNNQGESINQFKYSDREGYQKEFAWDGKDSKGGLVKDGFYSLKIYSTDRGGNYDEDTILNITVDTKEDPVEVSLIDGIFSPNNDKNKDTISFNFQILDKSDVDEWEFTIFNKNNKSIKLFKGTKNVPDRLIWDGNDEQGKLANEGDFFGQLRVTYINGNISKADSANFTLDVTPPSSDISLDVDVFSPDGNAIKDNVTIIQKISEEKTQWNAKIIDESNNVAISYSWKKNVPVELKWDGKDQDGSIVRDGNYYYQLSSTDLAGNYYESPKKKIAVFTAKTDVLIVPLLDTFSPDANGTADVQKFRLSAGVEKNNPITDWEVIIKDDSDNVIYSEKKSGTIEEEYIWLGNNYEGKTAPDGQYTAYLTANSFYGVTSTKKSKTFNIDLTPPDIAIERSAKIFSPDNDGFDDTITFRFVKAFDATGIKNWKLSIINPYTDKEFISYSGNGEPKDEIIWNGRGSNGQLVESVEDYPLILTSEDMVGNVLNKSLDPILIDILVIKLDDGRYKIRISNIRFKPDRAVMTDDQKNIEILNMLSSALKKFSGHKITIEGYANEYRKGLNEKQALKLSEQRSMTVSNELQKRGIDKERISTIGRGFENPIIPLKDNMTVDEKKEMAINRRVEFYLSK